MPLSEEGLLELPRQPRWQRVPVALPFLQRPPRLPPAGVREARLQTRERLEEVEAGAGAAWGSLLLRAAHDQARGFRGPRPRQAQPGGPAARQGPRGVARDLPWRSQRPRHVHPGHEATEQAAGGTCDAPASPRAATKALHRPQAAEGAAAGHAGEQVPVVRKDIPGQPACQGYIRLQHPQPHHRPRRRASQAYGERERCPCLLPRVGRERPRHGAE
mmetsp:Transcript_11106/g.32536  ORF Transcript_11106/g.32536 Transcript_11106/m.32536 type:complete len:217 (+) Transcript_11106:2713-3363(+)